MSDFKIPLDLSCASCGDVFAENPDMMKQFDIQTGSTLCWSCWLACDLPLEKIEKLIEFVKYRNAVIDGEFDDEEAQEVTTKPSNT